MFFVVQNIRLKFSLSCQMFKYKIKVSDARKAWMKNPEALQNCSTGFYFPSRSEEKFQVLKLLSIFYFLALFLLPKASSFFSLLKSISSCNFQEKVSPLKLLHFYSAEV